MNKCPLCKYYRPAQRFELVPICTRTNRNAFEEIKQCEEKHFEVSQPELKLVQEEMMIDYWSN